MNNVKICTHCGNIGNTKSYTKGSFIIELGLWLLFLIPGIIYSLWRLSTRRQVCKLCNSDQIFELDTPIGKLTEEKFSKYRTKEEPNLLL